MFAMRGRRRGFTMVEMLVVVAIIAVLAALLLPAVGSATRTARKSREINRIRQVGIAWNLYSNANEDGALPGFLPPDVQTRWKATYRLPDKGADSGDPLVPLGQVPPGDAEEWPWRLLPYLNYSQDVILGYQGLADMSQLRMSEYRTDPQFLDPDGMNRPVKIAQQPAFGYNAYYVGGWWEMVDVEGQLQPRHKYHDVTPLDPEGSPIMVEVQVDPSGGTELIEYRTNVVMLTPSTIRNSESLILFCSSSERPEGEYRRTDDFETGSHYVAAPIVDSQRLWGMSTARASSSVIDVFAPLTGPGTGVPIGRYNGQVAVLRADGHTDAQTPGALDDQRFWINTADHKNYTHQPPS